MILNVELFLSRLVNYSQRVILPKDLYSRLVLD